MARPERSERAPRVAHRLRPAFEERDIRRMWRALEDARAGERQPRWSRRFALAGTAVAAALVALLALLPGQSAPLALRDEGALPAALGAPEQRAVYDLDDGSHIVLERGARAEVLRNDGAELVTALRQGTSTFDVRPGGQRRWSIEAGVLSVQVVGTRFVVERDAARVRVAVERGTVLVRGARVPDGVRKLGAGESLEIATEPPSARQPAAPFAEPARPPPHAAAARLAPARAPSAPGGDPGWFVLSRGGARLAALSLLEREGGLAAVLARTHQPRLLLELADVARAAGDLEAAALALDRAMHGTPEAPEAALAAFTLGRLELEQLGRPRSAAQRFAFVLAHAQAASLAEDALVRLVEASAASGDQAAAREHAARYLERFPHGRRREFVARIAGGSP